MRTSTRPYIQTGGSGGPLQRPGDPARLYEGRPSPEMWRARADRVWARAVTDWARPAATLPAPEVTKSTHLVQLWRALTGQTIRRTDARRSTSTTLNRTFLEGLANQKTDKHDIYGVNAGKKTKIWP